MNKYEGKTFDDIVKDAVNSVTLVETNYQPKHQWSEKRVRNVKKATAILESATRELQLVHYLMDQSTKHHIKALGLQAAIDEEGGHYALKAAVAFYRAESKRLLRQAYWIAERVNKKRRKYDRLMKRKA